MTDLTEGNVERLNVRFRKREAEEPFLQPVWQRPDRNTCSHLRGPFVIDAALDHVECGECGAHLNPMHVLKLLTNEERRWHELHERYQDEMRRLGERERTKCQHCGRLTRISGR